MPAAVEDGVGDDPRGDRREQRAVAIVAGGVDQAGLAARAPITGSSSRVTGRRPARTSTSAASASAGTSSIAACIRPDSPAIVVLSSKPTSSTVAPTSRQPSARGTR